MLDGLTTQQLGQPDFDLALIQHAAYVDALKLCGASVTVLAGDERYPDACFIEDTAVLYRDQGVETLVITQPGAASRQGEIEAVCAFFSDWKQHRMTGHAIMDGGDVLFCANRVLIGISRRTNESGAAFLRRVLLDIDPSMRVDFVPFSGVLHLKTGITELAPNVLVRSPELVTDFNFDFAETVILPASESYAANVLPLGDSILIPAGYPTVEALAARHYTNVIPLEMGEFAKMDGGLTCLSLRW